MITCIIETSTNKNFNNDQNKASYFHFILKLNLRRFKTEENSYNLTKFVHHINFGTCAHKLFYYFKLNLKNFFLIIKPKFFLN